MTDRPFPDLTPPNKPPIGIPNVGRLVEKHSDTEIRVKWTGRFSVGSMRTGAWCSLHQFNSFADARAFAEDIAEERAAWEV